MATVIKRLQRVEQLERQLAEAQAIIEEFPHGAMGTLKRWYAQKQRAEQAEAQRDAAVRALVTVRDCALHRIGDGPWSCCCRRMIEHALADDAQGEGGDV